MAKPSRVDDVSAAAPPAPDGLAPTCKVDLFKARLRAALDPIDPYDPDRAPGSDHDLNPHLAMPVDGLQPAAVLIPLIERDAGLSVLFTLRADQLRRHAGQIAFPGGRCEPAEAPWDAALREAQEEVGLDPARVRIVGLSTPYRSLTGYHITPVIGFVDPAAAFTLNPTEVAEAFEVPFDFLMDGANHERRRREIPPGPPRWHYAITWRDRVIWGVTAALIRALHQRLEAVDGPA